jgi:hypothetical protein
MEPTRETTDTQEELHELLEMTRENNEILHGMRNRERIGNVFKVLYFGFILASFYGAYVFVQPYVKQVQNGLNAAQSVQKNVNGAVSGIGISPDQVGQIKDILNNLAKKQ